MCYVVGPVVGLLIFTRPDAILLDGLACAILIVAVLLMIYPVQILWSVIVANSVDMVYLHLALQWQAIECATNHLMHPVVFAAETDYTIAIGLLTTERPTELRKLLAGRRQYGAVFSAPKTSNWILLDLHDSPLRLQPFIQRRPL